MTIQEIIKVPAQKAYVSAPLNAWNGFLGPPVIKRARPDAEVLRRGRFGEELGFGRALGRPRFLQSVSVHGRTLVFRGSAEFFVNSRSARRFGTGGCAIGSRHSEIAGGDFPKGGIALAPEGESTVAQCFQASSSAASHFLQFFVRVGQFAGI